MAYDGRIMAMTRSDLVSAAAKVEEMIVFLRGQGVILDKDLARLYEVPTKALVQAVNRNRSRFPSDFTFQLTAEEFAFLRSHFGFCIFLSTFFPHTRRGWPRRPSLEALCVHGTGRRDAVERAQEQASNCRQHRDHARLCTPTQAGHGAGRVGAEAEDIGTEV